MTTAVPDRRSFERSIIERCQRIATSTWSDALDGLGIAGVMDGIVRRSGSGIAAGPALTVREEVGPLGSYTYDDFDLRRIIRTVEVGDIAVISMDGAAASTLGGLGARGARARGIAGVVIDGGCRDMDEIRAMGLCVSSRHVTPRSGKQRLKVAEIGGVVTCGGIAVTSGDLVVVDDTGVVAVPAARVPEVLSRAEELAAKDRGFVDALEAGTDFGTVATRLRHL